MHKKTPVLESLFNKVAGLKACSFIKKTPTQVFSCEYCEIFKKPFFIEHLRWLLLLFEVIEKRHGDCLLTSTVFLFFMNVIFQQATSYINDVVLVSLLLKSDSHLPKKFVLFAWLKALYKWWKMLFISS